MTTSPPSSSPLPIEITFTGDLASVAPAVETVLALLAEVAVPGTADELLLTEALNNAVVHGQDPDGSGGCVALSRDDAGYIEARITDGRRSLTAAQLASATLPQATAESGRGLPLVVALNPDARVEDGCLVLRFAAIPPGHH